MTPRTTAIALIVVVALIIVLDVILAVNAVKGDTISAVSWEAAKRLAVIPWGVGVVIGHVFLSPILAIRHLGPWPTWLTLGSLTATVVVGDLCLAPHDAQTIGVALLLGLVVGMFVWRNRGRHGG